MHVTAIVVIDMICFCVVSLKFTILTTRVCLFSMEYQIGDENLGRFAKTVVRDKSGKRRDLDQEAEADAEKARVKAAKDKKYADWGKG